MIFLVIVRLQELLLMSNAKGKEARFFLEDVRVTFPQVLCVLKTRQVTYSVLTHLSEYIQNLQKTGLLEEKEMVHLDDALQTDLKLERNLLLVKMPTVSDLLNTCPLVGALPAAVCDPLLSNTKETVKGVAKWTSQRLSGRHSWDPILSHGSTLGLYEVLTRQSYICDMITDSVVFFIKAEKIEKLHQSDPSIGAFLWQESALVIARILLPQIFEKMAMHEMRGLIAERSTMNIYIKGEDIKPEQNYIGILLEGFLRTNNQNMITPPGVLLPFGLQSSAMNHMDYCYTAPSYQVEARARIIFFETGWPEREEADLQRSASLLGPPRTLSKEHIGLLSWPESSRNSRAPQNASLTETRNQTCSFSARALQFSMYGSMMNDMYSARRRHSSSYPRVPSRPSIHHTASAACAVRGLQRHEQKSCSFSWSCSRHAVLG